MYVGAFKILVPISLATVNYDNINILIVFIYSLFVREYVTRITQVQKLQD